MDLLEKLDYGWMGFSLLGFGDFGCVAAAELDITNWEAYQAERIALKFLLSRVEKVQEFAIAKLLSDRGGMSNFFVKIRP